MYRIDARHGFLRASVSSPVIATTWVGRYIPRLRTISSTRMNSARRSSSSAAHSLARMGLPNLRTMYAISPIDASESWWSLSTASWNSLFCEPGLLQVKNSGDPADFANNCAYLPWITPGLSEIIWPYAYLVASIGERLRVDRKQILTLPKIPREADSRCAPEHLTSFSPDTLFP